MQPTKSGAEKAVPGGGGAAHVATHIGSSTIAS
jgi:hypothetical protein